MIQNALAQHRSRLDFSHTPLCKALWYSGLFLSLVVMLVDGRDLFWFSPIEIIQHPRQWVMRTAFSTLFYSGSLGLCIGLFLLYKFRIFERNLGTQKFSVLVLLAFFLNVVFNISALALTLSLFQANSPELSALISPAKGTAGTLPASAASSLSLLKRAAILPTNGLEWLISALLVLYVSDVPRGYVFRVFGVCMSDKWLVYTLYAQLLLAGLPHNILLLLPASSLAFCTTLAAWASTRKLQGLGFLPSALPSASLSWTPLLHRLSSSSSKHLWVPGCHHHHHHHHHPLLHNSSLQQQQQRRQQQQQ